MFFQETFALSKAISEHGMQPRSHKYRRLIIIVCAIVAIAVVIGLFFTPINSALTRYVEGPRFRVALEQETAKGLHFPSSEFAPIRRTGSLNAESATFKAENGRKAITRLEAQGITGRFNPFGVLLRRWQIDDLHIDRATIGIQIYEPKPEPSPAKPWYHIFLPDRVYLKRVWSDNVDVTWPMRGERGGIFQTHLLVTPHGRDFEYRANGGRLTNPLIPELAVREIHLLITKKILNLYRLDLGSGEGSIHGRGSTALAGEKGADFRFEWDGVPVRDWLPKSWSGDFGGVAGGDLHWTGKNYKLAAATMTGAISIKDGHVTGLKFLDDMAAVADQKDLTRLDLDECRTHFRWTKEECELSEIHIEQIGKFRIEGSVSFSKQSLGGTLQIGLAPEYLAWLPHSEEVFPRRSGGYLWATMHLSGTLDSPRQDLSPRLVEALKGSPAALIGAGFRALRAWLQSD